MNYDKNRTVRDFAERTRQNLTYIEQTAADNKAKVYEVTQLINSLLGLLVFPHQRYYEFIPATPLDELHKAGWPQIKMVCGETECQDLRQLVRYLRNAVAHFNMEFRSDESGELTGMRVWNERGRHKNWEALMTIDDVRRLTECFIDMLVSQNIA